RPAAEGRGDQGPLPRSQRRQDRRRTERRGRLVPRRPLRQPGRPRFLHPEERQPLAPAARPEGGGQGRVGNPGAAPQRRRARAEGAGAARQGGVIARGYSAASASGSSSAASTKPQSAAISPAAAA